MNKQISSNLYLFDNKFMLKQCSTKCFGHIIKCKIIEVGMHEHGTACYLPWLLLWLIPHDNISAFFAVQYGELGVNG